MLGGMSWQSSAAYYRLANELVRECLGGLHSARIVLASVDSPRSRQAAGRWDEAGQLFAGAARGLEAAGADLLLLCTNTMHKAAHHVQTPQLTCRAAQRLREPIPLPRVGDFVARSSRARPERVATTAS